MQREARSPPLRGQPTTKTKRRKPGGFQLEFTSHGRSRRPGVPERGVGRAAPWDGSGEGPALPCLFRIRGAPVSLARGCISPAPPPSSHDVLLPSVFSLSLSLVRVLVTASKGRPGVPGTLLSRCVTQRLSPFELLEQNRRSPSGLNHMYFYGSGDQEFKIKAPGDTVCGGGRFLGHRHQLLTGASCPGRTGKGTPGSPSVRGRCEWRGGRERLPSSKDSGVRLQKPQGHDLSRNPESDT